MFFFLNCVTVWNVHAEKHLSVFTTPLVGLVYSIDTVRRCEVTKETAD